MMSNTELMEVLKPHFEEETAEAVAWMKEDKAHSITDAHDMSGEAFIYATYKATFADTDTVADLMQKIYSVAFMHGYKAALDPLNGQTEDDEDEENGEE